VRGARRPLRRLRRDGGRDGLVIENGYRVIQQRNTRPVREGFAERHAFLARLRELRPHVGDTMREGQFLRLHGVQHTRGGRPLRGAPHEHQRVARPRLRLLAILPAARERDDFHAVLPHGDRRPHFAVAGKVFVESSAQQRSIHPPNAAPSRIRFESFSLASGCMRALTVAEVGAPTSSIFRLIGRTDWSERTWRQPLECGGLTPLSEGIAGGRGRTSASALHPESAVKPAHSKASRHSRELPSMPAPIPMRQDRSKML
jgi:hypothetical protein